MRHREQAGRERQERVRGFGREAQEGRGEKMEGENWNGRSVGCEWGR